MIRFHEIKQSEGFDIGCWYHAGDYDIYYRQSASMCALLRALGFIQTHPCTSFTIKA